jgi:hypothetical protein
MNALGIAINEDHLPVARFLKSRGAIASVKKEKDDK